VATILIKQTRSLFLSAQPLKLELPSHRKKLFTAELIQSGQVSVVFGLSVWIGNLLLDCRMEKFNRLLMQPHHFDAFQNLTI